METCKYGSGASTRKPPTARWVWRWVLSPHSFGTACNVTGDGAIALIIDKFFGKKNHRPIQ